MRFSDDFEDSQLDTEVWVPHYLPMWSSRAESAAVYSVAGSELRLSIPSDQGLWCPGEHDPLRVSGIQSGVFSGEVGSTIGQQPFREGVVVRDEHPPWGWGSPQGLVVEAGAGRDGSPPRWRAGGWTGGEERPPRSRESLSRGIRGTRAGARETVRRGRWECDGSAPATSSAPSRARRPESRSRRRRATRTRGSRAETVSRSSASG